LCSKVLREIREIKKMKFSVVLILKDSDSKVFVMQSKDLFDMLIKDLKENEIKWNVISLSTKVKGGYKTISISPSTKEKTEIIQIVSKNKKK
jgi:hypothetical protein